MITRRTLIGSLATLLAAPALVRASSLMPVKAWAYDWREDSFFDYPQPEAPRRPKFRISGTDAHGNYIEEFVHTLGGDGSPLATANAYRSVTIELLEPVRNVANVWNLYA